VEPGYASGELEAALAIPLQSGGAAAGVLALYRRERDTFTGVDASTVRSLSALVTDFFESGGAARPIESSDAGQMELAAAV
jgi:transcriptional regulator with GAF, ATPase, and Fis domain